MLGSDMLIKDNNRFGLGQTLAVTKAAGFLCSALIFTINYRRS